MRERLEVSFGGSFYINLGKVIIKIGVGDGKEVGVDSFGFDFI